MKQFTKEQTNNFKAYLKVQKKGKYNMFDPRAVGATGLTSAEYGFVMDNYGELALIAENLEK
jgi:hypothetical protein